MNEKKVLQVIKKKSDMFTFGKHKGKSICSILLDDPSYILWLDMQEIVEFSDEIIEEAEEKDDSRDYSIGDMPENWGDLD